MPSWHAYHRATRSATYGFLSALPLFVVYETMILVGRADGVGTMRVSAGVLIKQALALTGASGGLVLALLLVGGGLAAYLLDRNRSIPLRSEYFAGLVGESAVYAVAVTVLVSSVVGVLFTAMAPQSGALWNQLALSIGAGLYEELLFRVLLVGGLALVFRSFMTHTAAAYPLAAILGAVLFSFAHYVGPFGDIFALPTFTYRFFFGLALNGLFLWRGFGVAAWTHALYDVMLVTGLLA